MIKLAVDLIVNYDGRIVLIERKKPPYGWALPGGKHEEGETVEDAAIRELNEETNLEAKTLKQFHVYSDPKRDPRWHAISVVFTCEGQGELKPQSDAKKITTITMEELPFWKEKLAFDHYRILKDYFLIEKNKNPVHGGGLK